MSVPETREQIDSIYQKIVGPLPGLTLSRRRVAGWDSLRHAQLIIALQKIFRIQATAVELANMESLTDIYSWVESKLP